METLDVSPGEVAAVSDYTNLLTLRTPADFLVVPSGDCLLCGRLDSMRPLATAHHLHSKEHRRHAALYRTCMLSLLSHERSALESREGCASRREVVLMYLGHRLARTDMIVGGMGEYNQMAVSYLLHRASAPDLVRTFARIQGREYDSTRGMCSIFLERPSYVLFQSCTHLCACRLCVAKMRAHSTAGDTDSESIESDNLACPICRKVSAATSVFIV